MSRAEKFISDCTRNCSNELIAIESRAGKEVISYHEWLTPDQARKAVEIAREEMMEDICKWLKQLQVKPTYFDVDWLQKEWYFERDKLIKDLKQAIKDE